MVKFILSLGFLLLLLSCKSRQSESQVQGITSKFLWPNPSLSLCYEDRLKLIPDLQDYRNLLTPVIKAEFSRETTGIHFTGFYNCSVAPQSNIRVVLAEQLSVPGLFGISASFGTQKLGNSQPLAYLYGSYGIVVGIGPHRSSSNPLQFLIWTILHELGHVAGLQHEHAHKNSTCDKGESAIGKFESLEFNIAQGSYHNYGTKYDPRSIMNYCSGHSFIKGEVIDRLGRTTNKATLSTCDRAFLKHLYARTEIPSYCKENPDPNTSKEPVFIKPNLRLYDERNQLPSRGFQ